MRRLVTVLAVVLIVAAASWSSGSGEAAGSAARSTYLAQRGIIVPPDEVQVDSYIASIDYDYPDPVETIGITMASGNRQLSTAGQEEIVHIGIQARRSPFEELPPLNLAFVIDHSGSMASQDKLDWVKQAFDIFIGSVRDIDYVSLVIFDDEAQVVFPSTRMSTQDRRAEFRAAVRAVRPGGGTNLAAGLQLGYQQVLANFRREYTNRVLFLTDGLGEPGGPLEMAERFRETGINVSTIGVGESFDLDLMTELARRGGGSSRFISDREQMEQIFGNELDRMVVSAARNLEMSLRFALDVEVLGTWGYNCRVEGRVIRYTQATLHHGDYETILAQIRIPPGFPAGMAELARFEMAYEDLDGARRVMGPYVLQADFVNRPHPVAGFSSGLVLRSGTMLHFAQSLIRVGDLYYYGRAPAGTSEAQWRAAFKASGQQVSPSGDSLEEALEVAVASRKELANARLRLDNIGFEKEVAILDRYLETLRAELRVRGGRPETATDEIAPPVRARPLQEHIQGLFREMALSIPAGEQGVIAVSGFTARGRRETGLTAYLNEMAVIEMSRHPGLRLVERDRLDRVVQELALSMSDLMDTTTAVRVGQMVAADRIITGSVIEMGESVVVFGRIIDLESGEVESAAQVILPKDAQVRSLLS